MGRPPKDADNVLVRLRKQISNPPTEIVTRRMLAARIGLSASTIREIETSGFKLTPAVVQRLMLKTGVSTQSLLNAENPLKDIRGRELTHLSAAEWMSDLYYQEEVNLFAMLEAALKAAKEKRGAAVFYELFKEWLPQAVAAIGATSTMKSVLNRNLGVFDPHYVPEVFKPKDAKTKAKWDAAWEKLQTSAIDKAGGIEKASHDSVAYAEAYQDILNSGSLRETSPGTLKPVSGKQPRSPGRPPV
jgi:plasmid maintenance system antidote protein VapI